MSTKVSALTQATGSEMGDDSLVYVVTDPSGTPASKKSTIARATGIKKSWVLDVVELVTPTLDAVNRTTGHYFFPIRANQTCTGIRVYWPGTSVVTLKLCLYKDGTAAAVGSGTVTTTGAAGYYSVTFGSPVTLDRKFAYAATCYETGGADCLTAVTMLSAGGVYFVAPGWGGGAHYRDYVVTTWGLFGSGDSAPVSGAGTGSSYPVEPLISG